mmetsp:Transcript_4619/g.9991  ORF Transcript_4619/g.9991 Transcript_4619/m.9991 type:complete len:209 (-) Transcript_4619:873-1499(-)
MNHHPHHCQQALPVLPQHTHGLFAAASQHAFHPIGPHAVHNVPCQAEGHHLRRVEEPALLKGDAQVNVHNLGGVAVQEDVARVAVAQADDVAGHAVDGHAAAVHDPLLEPGGRVSEPLKEEVMQHGREAGAHVVKLLALVGWAGGLQELPGPDEGEVSWGLVPRMCTPLPVPPNQVIAEACGVLHPLHQTRAWREGDDLICHHAQLSA